MPGASSPIRLGILGCGRAPEQLHLPALRSVPALNVAAIADADADRARTLAAKFDVPRVYGDFGSMLASGSVDAVAVCTPPTSHANLAIGALEAGLHVFVEKPLAVSLEDGRRMVEAAQRSGKVAAVGFNQRCHRLVGRARDLVSGGALGKIRQVATVWSAGFQHEPDMPAWRSGRATGGGVLFELGIHHVDLCRYLLGERIARLRVEACSGVHEDECVGLLGRTEGGVLVVSSLSQTSSQANEVQIFGDEGHLSFSLFRASSFRFTARAAAQTGLASHLRQLQWLRETPQLARIAMAGGDFFSSYREQWGRFAAAIRGEGRPVSDFGDGLEALRVVCDALAMVPSAAPENPTTEKRRHGEGQDLQ